MVNFTTTAEALSAAWSAPSAVFPSLLIVGGDIVKSALAQLAGEVFVPVTFSFGTCNVLCSQERIDDSRTNVSS
jgi:hypothetical protein